MEVYGGVATDTLLGHASLNDLLLVPASRSL